MNIKPICKHGHDTIICGRNNSGQCIDCRKSSYIKKGRKIVKKQFCIHGHDTFEYGRDKNGGCHICNIEYRNAHAKGPKPIQLFCIHGHEIAIMGRDSRGKCNQCLFLKKNPRKKVQFCPRGHDTFICGRQKSGPCNDCRREKQRERRKHDILYKLSSALHIRLYKAIKRNQKSGSAIRDLGCTIKFLKEYISSKFHDGMTWQNWGKVWELDHIKALMFFNLSDREQFLEACHYTNLQPLTIEEHRKKTLEDMKKFYKIQKTMKRLEL